MRKLIGLLALITLSLSAYGEGVPQKTQTDSFIHGRAGSTDDKVLEFDTGDGASNTRIVVDDANQDLGITSNKVKIGDGTGSAKTIEADNGAGNPPYMKWDETNQRWVFSNDGLGERAIGSGGGGSGINILENPDFEGGLSDWTNSGASTFVAATGGSQLFGDRSGVWDASTTSETLCSDAVTIPTGLRDKQGLVQMFYKWDSGVSGDIIMEARDGSDVVLASVNPAPTTSAGSTAVYQAFNFPSSGSVKMCLRSTANAAAITIDNAHLGSNIREVQLDSSRVLGSVDFSATANCGTTQWVTSSGTFADFSADSDCPTYSSYGLATAPATKIPAITFPGGVPEGRLEISVGSQFFRGGSTSGTAICGWRVSDGTTHSKSQSASQSVNEGSHASENLIFDIPNYPGSSGSTTFSVQAARLSGNGTCEIRSDATDFNLTVKYFPKNPQNAVTLDQQGAFGSIRYVGQASCDWDTTSATYANLPADSDCADPIVTGRMIAAGTKIAGGVVNNILPGDYMVIANGRIESDASTGCRFRIHDGTTGDGEISQVAGQAASDNIIAHFRYNSFQSTRTFIVQAERVSGAGTCGIPNTSSDQAFKMLFIDLQKSSGVVIPNAISAPGELGGKVCSAKVTESSGNYSFAANGVFPAGCAASIDDNATGDVDLNFAASYWSQIPVCTANASGSRKVGTITTLTDVQLSIFSTSATASDESFMVSCIGK